jgi:hypothetical protein
MVEKQSGIAANPDTSQKAGCHDRCWALRSQAATEMNRLLPRCFRLPDDEPSLEVRWVQFRCMGLFL